MKKLTPEEFALICFLVLMENGSGITDKSPDYVEEKRYIIGLGEEAFAHLDIYNMRKVVGWCNAWRCVVPHDAFELYSKSEQAMTELESRGFKL